MWTPHPRVNGPHRILSACYCSQLIDPCLSPQAVVVNTFRFRGPGISHIQIPEFTLVQYKNCVHDETQIQNIQVVQNWALSLVQSSVICEHNVGYRASTVSYVFIFK